MRPGDHPCVRRPGAGPPSGASAPRLGRRIAPRDRPSASRGGPRRHGGRMPRRGARRRWPRGGMRTPDGVRDAQSGGDRCMSVAWPSGPRIAARRRIPPAPRAGCGAAAWRRITSSVGPGVRRSGCRFGRRPRIGSASAESSLVCGLPPDPYDAARTSRVRSASFPCGRPSHPSGRTSRSAGAGEALLGIAETRPCAGPRPAPPTAPRAAIIAAFASTTCRASAATAGRRREQERCRARRPAGDPGSAAPRGRVRRRECLPMGPGRLRAGDGGRRAARGHAVGREAWVVPGPSVVARRGVPAACPHGTVRAPGRWRAGRGAGTQSIAAVPGGAPRNLPPPPPGTRGTS